MGRCLSIVVKEVTPMLGEQEQQPDQNSHPRPSPEQEVRVAVAKAHLGGKEVPPGSNHWIAALENSGEDHLKAVADQTRQALLARMLMLEPEVLARRSSDEGHSVVFSPKLACMDPRSEHGSGGYLIPPWQELHPEIGQIFRRGTEHDAGPKHLREMEFHSRGDSQLDIVRSPIAIMLSDRQLENSVATPVGEHSVVVLWSKAAFIECSETFIRQFEHVQTGGVAAQNDLSALKLGHGRRHSWQNQGQHTPEWIGEVPLQQLLDRCPSYLAGLVAYEAAQKAVRETLARDESPEISVTGIKFRANWSLEVTFKFDQEQRELVISPHLPEKLSFDWADENHAITDLANQWF